jgi:hypothetical protein
MPTINCLCPSELLYRLITVSFHPQLTYWIFLSTKYIILTPNKGLKLHMLVIKPGLEACISNILCPSYIFTWTLLWLVYVLVFHSSRHMQMSYKVWSMCFFFLQIMVMLGTVASGLGPNCTCAAGNLLCKFHVWYVKLVITCAAFLYTAFLVFFSQHHVYFSCS